MIGAAKCSIGAYEHQKANTAMNFDKMPHPAKRRNVITVNDREIPRRHFLLAAAGVFVVFGGAFGGIVWASWSRAQEDSRGDEEVSGLVALAQRRGWTYRARVAGGADRYEGVTPFPDVSSGLSSWDCVEGRHRGRAVRCFEYRDVRTVQSAGPGRSLTKTSYYAVFSVTAPDAVPPSALHAADADAPLRFHRGELITWSRGRLREEAVLPKLNYLCDVLDRAFDSR
ncbi:hypothetical protein HCJ76_15495 [Streptomyces sp. MC1]|uniref:hypothetical protein n=1 Tax=Streptomyces sp. MC1 TaxID=295105 RepID=UPI0018CB210D|nr:hypothetical protein [Streptomyces sp. MC1]MBG7699450.1 hypothetical protein [Streptomyces sp. MC1]